MMRWQAIVFIIVFGVLAVGASAVAGRCFCRERKKRAVLWLSMAGVCAANAAVVAFWHENYFRFCPLNLAYLAFFCMAGVLAAVYFRAERQKKILNYVFSGIFAFFISIRLFYPIPFYHRIPLNVCNIATLFIIARPFLKSKMADGYMLFFVFAGILMNLFLGEFYGKGFDFFYYEGFVSNSLHFFFITYLIYFFSRNEYTVTKKASIANAVWIVPLYVILIFLNQVYEYNYFFTSVHRNPILFLYNLFPVFTAQIGGRVFEFNIIFYLSLMAGVLTLLFLSGWLLERLGKRRTDF